MIFMKTISYHRHHFHQDIIKQAIWLYFQFTMSYRDVEELLAEHSIDVNYETVRRWALNFGIDYARRIKKRRPYPIQKGIWMKYSSRLVANLCTSGASLKKVKS